jgi:hypothetical protein
MIAQGEQKAKGILGQFRAGNVAIEASLYGPGGSGAKLEA